MAVKPKENRTSLKQEFKHFTAIPFYLRDENLDFDQANEWQGFLVEGRKKGFGSRSYAWGLFNVKYVWHEDSKKWIERAVGKVLYGEPKDILFKRLLEIVLGGRDHQYANFAGMVDEVIRDLIKFREGICGVEEGMTTHPNKPVKLKPSDLMDEPKNVLDSAVTNSAVVDVTISNNVSDNLSTNKIGGVKHEKESGKEKK